VDVALPATSPPIRKKVSWTEIGLPAWLVDEPAGPTVSKVLENTMFHTEPFQLPKLLSREYHCCWDAVETWPVTLLSAM
jgi:hypothetical protein